MSTNDTRKSQLLSLKLRALVREHLGRSSDDGLTPAVFARGAAVIDGDSCWVLVEDQSSRGLGPALLWALKEGRRELHVLAETATGILTRQAGYLDFPVSVWHVDGRALISGVAEPFADQREPSAEHLEFVELIERGGATPIIEHGIVAGEVLGLEVCRAVNDPVTGAARLEVGMGAHDREAFALLHGDKPTVEALSDVVSSVKQHRRPGALAHPFNRIAPERSLRAAVIDDPRLVGVARLEACDPPFARTNVLDTVPCVARGTTASGTDVVVVVTSGADPDVVPFALDARAHVDLRFGTDSELLIAMPRSHVTPTNRRALLLARRPATFVELDTTAAPPS